MNLKTNEIDNKAMIYLSPKDYVIVHTKDELDAETAEFYGEYALAHRIDMSYTGKQDQIGSIQIYISKEEAERLKKAGFGFIS